jgi:sulfate adenylyltransferase subunit 2
VNNKRAAERAATASLLPHPLDLADLRDEVDRPLKAAVAPALVAAIRQRRMLSLYLQLHQTAEGQHLLAANDARQGRRWVFISCAEPDKDELIAALHAIAAEAKADVVFWPHGRLTAHFRTLADSSQRIDGMATALAAYNPLFDLEEMRASLPRTPRHAGKLTHLDRLEAESIHIMREVAAEADNPVMLYSVGKDSAVMLHLARKAFYPSRPPFPLLHVDTRWKFQEMYQFRDQMARDAGMDLLVHINPDGVQKDINPIDHGSALHTDIMKTEGLKQALTEHRFDVAFGGARRDEEKSRAKERIFSFRNAAQRWDPKNQRPELWNLYNTRKRKGESIRVFPISNWTELDVWEYIYRERIPIVPLYFAALRPVIQRDGMLLLIDDDRLKPGAEEIVEFRKVRFRTLGCYPLTGAIESDADDLASVILELLQSRNSERQGRLIDTDSAGSMEKKKQEGYF